jgi:hypothetical protein
MMEPLAVCLAATAFLLLNAILVIMRFFAQSHGLEVRWWSRGYTEERRYLRRLAQSDDPDVAKQARLYLRLEVAAWVLFAPPALFLLWSYANR